MRVTSSLVLSLEPYFLTIVIFLPMIITSFSQQKGGVKLPHLEGGYCITLQGGQGSKDKSHKLQLEAWN